MKKIGLTAAALAAWFAYNRNQTRKLRIRTPKVVLENAQSSFRITHITDFHNHKHLDPFGVASEILAFDPLFVAVTGDLISEKDKDFQQALEFAKVLVNTEKPVLYVTGNHEYHNPHRKSFLEQLEALGVRRLGHRIESFPEAVVAGIDYPAEEQGVPGFPRTDRPKIMLAHSPSDIKDLDLGADLILCGHTHGGQVRLPGIGAIIVPSQGFFAPVNKGLYPWGEGQLYIDSGIGNTRLDLRAFNPIQFTNMTIVTHR